MKRTDTYIKIIATVLFAALLVYLVSWIWKSSRNRIATEEAVKETVNDSVEAAGLAVRDEIVLSSTKQYVSIQVEDGKAVSKNAVVAVATDSDEELSAANRMTEIDAEISRLESVLAKATSAVDVSNKEENIDSAVKALSAAVATGNISSMEGAALDISSLVLQQNAVADAQTRLDNLTEEREDLESEQNGQAALVGAPAAGLFSMNLDGYENKDCASMEGVTVTQLKDLMESEPQTEESAYGKIITSYVWEFAATVDSSVAEKLQPDSEVSLYFPGYYSYEIPAVVVSLSPEENGLCAVVFSAKTALADTLTMREETAEVIFSQQEGLMVPKKAMHVDDDGDTYVFCLTAQQVEKKSVEILATEDDGYLVSIDTSADALHEGDTIIVSGSNLYEGKVIEQ